MTTNKDMLFKIFEKVSEVSEKVGIVEAKCESMEEDIKQIKEEDAKQNGLIAEHISGVKTNTQRLELEIENRKDQNKSIESRLVVVEEPRHFFKFVKKAAIFITAIGTAIIVIYKIVQW